MEMLYRLSYVGAHDRDHPSGQRGSDAVPNAVIVWPMREGWLNPGVWKRHTTPKATSSLKVVWGVARNAESSAAATGRQRKTTKSSGLASAWRAVSAMRGGGRNPGQTGRPRAVHRLEYGAGNGIRTRDPRLGRPML